MSLLLRRYVWVVDLIGIGIGAVLAGHAAATLIAAALPQHAATPPPSHPRKVKSIEGIVWRDTICETAMARPYDLAAQRGDARICALEDVRIVLDIGGGQREILALRSPGPAGFTSDRAPDWIVEGIRQIGMRRYEIRRTAIDRLLQGGLVPPWPRLVPESRDGQPIGFRLFGIGGDSPVAAIGLTGGDLVLQLNGRSLATPEEALAAYTALRRADHFWLLIERDGRLLRLDYDLR